jgi:osmotically-inducible protein OsmY
MKKRMLGISICSILFMSLFALAPLAGRCSSAGDAANDIGEATEQVVGKIGSAAQGAADKIGDVASDAVDYADDSVVTARVKAQFVSVKGLKTMDINVRTKGGVVTLRGEVETQSQADLAGQVAGQVVGVKEVVNAIQVKH